MTAILVTLIFLLADGSPAKLATVSCAGLAVFTAGDDASQPIAEGTPLILDSRGATILSVERPPQTIACWARFETQAWRDEIVLSKRDVRRFWLEHES